MTRLAYAYVGVLALAIAPVSEAGNPDGPVGSVAFVFSYETQFWWDSTSEVFGNVMVTDPIDTSRNGLDIDLRAPLANYVTAAVGMRRFAEAWTFPEWKADDRWMTVRFGVRVYIPFTSEAREVLGSGPE